MGNALSRRGFLFTVALAPRIVNADGDQRMGVANTVNRALIWRRVRDEASIEHATVESVGEGIALSGTVLTSVGGKPLRVDYRLLVDASWRSRLLDVRQEFDGEVRSLTLTSNGLGQWLRDGRESPDLRDCVDVDLNFTPITNALPLNRLDIGRAGSVDIVAAWVRLPQLTVAPARQRYERVAPGVFRYASVFSGFQTTIRVDDLNFPIEYEGVWTRIGVGRAT